MKPNDESLCESCENGTPEKCLLNPGGDCMKGDYQYYTPRGEAGRLAKANEPFDEGGNNGR